MLDSITGFLEEDLKLQVNRNKSKIGSPTIEFLLCGLVWAASCNFPMVTSPAATIDWKRWKKVKTRYNQLRRLRIQPEEAWKVANTRKDYWRVSLSETLHKAIKNKTFIKWGLKDLNHLYERAYSTY